MVRIGRTLFRLCINKYQIGDLLLYSRLNANLNNPTPKAFPSRKPTMPTTFRVNTHPSEPYKLDPEHNRITSGPKALLAEQVAQLRDSNKDINMIQSSLTNEEFSKMDIRRESNGFVHTALRAYNHHHHLILRCAILLRSFINNRIN